ncbi:hypothetical protein BGZ58_000297 [Dissophora ornata]|nr:hypothetical protein BGZ58_000297 [Dissophora ornata]
MDAMWEGEGRAENRKPQRRTKWARSPQSTAAKINGHQTNGSGKGKGMYLLVKDNADKREKEDEEAPQQLGEDRSLRVKDLDDGNEVEDQDDQAEERAREERIWVTEME